MPQVGLNKPDVKPIDAEIIAPPQESGCDPVPCGMWMKSGIPLLSDLGDVPSDVVGIKPPDGPCE
ncbi:MAG TPA: hypothetical protein VKU79_05805 [Thermoplasmataceae archaeon]|nr:hypothetical protein [Thermoplasmataceae archaeon]